MAIAATTVLAFACCAQLAAADEDQALATAPNTASLINADFRLPANSRWREEHIMSAPKLKLSVDLGAGQTVRGTMSLLSRQVLNIDVLTEKNVRLKYVQSDTTSDIDFGKNRNRLTTAQPLDGKTVLAERVVDQDVGLLETLTALDGDESGVARTGSHEVTLAAHDWIGASFSLNSATRSIRFSSGASATTTANTAWWSTRTLSGT